MKNKFKSFSISLMIVFLLVTISCQVEETIVETENIKNQNDLLIKKISFNEIKNSAVVDKINNTKKLSKKTITTSSKIIKDTLNNFYINSDEGMYIEKTDGTKSYTFSVFRENATDLENLVIIVYPNNQIKTFLVDYNKTFNELNSMSLEQMQNNQIEYYEINFNTNEFIPVFQNNSNGRYICETIIFWDTIPCYEGDLVGAGQGIDCWGWVIIGHTCWEGGSGGGEGFGFDSDFGTNGNGSPTGGGGSTGSGSSGSSSNQIITTPTTSLESEQEAQALIKRQKNFTANLSWNQNAWLNNNQEAENNIYEYLESQVTDTLATEYSTESVQFVNELIDLAIENNNSQESIEEINSILNLLINNTPVIVGPDIPITNMSDYLSCFNTSQGATITIYADQPKANTHNLYSSNDGVGHAFFSIKQNNNIATLGFYPLSSVGSLFGATPGIFGNDQNHTFDVSISTQISNTKLQEIMNLLISINNPIYDLHQYNCTDVAMAIANLSNISILSCESPSPWTGDTPGTLGEIIRDLPTPSNGSKNTIGGNSPFNNCN